MTTVSTNAVALSNVAVMVGTQLRFLDRHPDPKVADYLFHAKVQGNLRDLFHDGRGIHVLNFRAPAQLAELGPTYDIEGLCGKGLLEEDRNRTAMIIIGADEVVVLAKAIPTWPGFNWQDYLLVTDEADYSALIRLEVNPIVTNLEGRRYHLLTGSVANLPFPNVDYGGCATAA